MREEKCKVNVFQSKSKRKISNCYHLCHKTHNTCTTIKQIVTSRTVYQSMNSSQGKICKFDIRLMTNSGMVEWEC